LHIGHLLPIITAKRFINFGHKAIILIGGATASIGDPTGRNSSRPNLSQEEIDSNIKVITEQVKSILGDCIIVNNADWTKNLNFLDFVQDTGKHFSVNTMIKSDTFKSRLETGLSFLEFSYALLQGNDFHHLFKNHNCTLQIGGSDQFANILHGINLIHKKEHKEAFGLTIPLLTDSNGNKFGKSAGNAIWLDKNKTSVFDFWQFWRNVPDDMVNMLLRFFTFLSVEEINNDFVNTLGASFAKPGVNINDKKAQLASIVTEMVHGAEETRAVENKVQQLFRAPHSLTELDALFESPKFISEIMVALGIAKSKSDAIRLIAGNGVKIDGNLVTNNCQLNEGTFFIEKGKKEKRRFKIV
jgi:tyrosyl-tRNA synthetase